MMRKGETANRSGYRIRQTRTLQRFFRGDHFCQYPVRLIPTDPLFARLIGMNPTVAVFTQRQECRQIIPGQYARSIIPMVNLRSFRGTRRASVPSFLQDLLAKSPPERAFQIEWIVQATSDANGTRKALGSFFLRSNFHTISAMGLRIASGRLASNFKSPRLGSGSIIGMIGIIFSPSLGSRRSTQRNPVPTIEAAN